MVFSTTNLFKGIPCPEGEGCKLTNCIYGHQPRQQTSETAISAASQASLSKPHAPSNGAHVHSNTSSEQHSEPALKRRKITYDSLADKPPTKAEKIRADLEATRSNASASHKTSPQALKPTASQPNAARSPASLTKPVTPPPGSGQNPASKQTSTSSTSMNVKSDPSNKPTTESKKTPPVKKESLNPRLLTSAPESHAKRTVFVQHLHKDMQRLNNELTSSTQPINSIPPDRLKVLALSDQEVIKLALDEEEKAAREQPKVYANVIKNRIFTYRKMKVEAFVDVVKTSFGKGAEKPPAVKEGKAIITGLTPAEEVEVARRLVVADQSKLAHHGYVPVPPTAAETAEAARAVEASMNYEECDRCTARFRVFPDRNDEGKLTSNGPCKHHPNKKVFPTKQKTDHYTGGNQPFYPCCMEQVGAPGCTSVEDHAFKASSPARLSAVLPFITTPENPNPAKDSKGRTVGAVSFDCEMGYTVFGLELIRLTAVSWPDNEPLLDILVRPLGTVIDLNSRFSGVWPEHFASAIPYDTWKQQQHQQPAAKAPSPDPKPLPIVSSPTHARALLCSYLTPSTPLIGHAIENDLNATRLCHPSIIDTILLYPHPRGLPLRKGLKMLAKQVLERDIQMGGDRGHDSLEDAVATGDLVRVEVGRVWGGLKGGGGRFEGGGLLLGETEGGGGGGREMKRKRTISKAGL
ncbi:hypothetical protein Q7P37_003710 [Cladosporium fusiforme]